MRKQGIKPTPGIVSIVNLATLIPELRFFYDYAASPKEESGVSQ
jgi:hypothetical protein